MENDSNIYESSRTFSQDFYFYPRIYSDKCHFDLAWYKKIFYFIIFMPRIYFYGFKKLCSAIFLGKVATNRKYIGYGFEIWDRCAGNLCCISIYNIYLFYFLLCYAFFDFLSFRYQFISFFTSNIIGCNIGRCIF